MRQAWLSLLVILLIPVFLLGLVVIHELGHTLLARLLGDPGAVFYLVGNEEADGCTIGCTYYDVTKLSWGANLAVSIAGLLAGQLVALAALLLLGLRRYGNRLFPLLLSIIALGFAFFDVPWQVWQGLTADLNHRTWPTGADLIDFLLLLQMKITASQLLLKGFLLIMAVLYVSGFVRLYRRNRMGRNRPEPAIRAA